MTVERTLTGLREAAPPTVLPSVELGTGLVDGYALFPSPLGEVAVAFNPAGVSAVDLADDGFEERFRDRFGRRAIPAQAPRRWADRIEEALTRGRPGRLPVDFRRASSFHRSVLEAAATIPYGEVRPYAWLARLVGRPAAVRAVGSAVARNPVPLIVPCHRVVRSDGRIGNYSLGGPDQKWALLRQEGADPDLVEALAGRGVRYLGSDTTRVFCHPTCRAARRITDRHRVEFGERRLAEQSGFWACSKCRP